MIQDNIAKALAAMPAGVEPELSVKTKALYAPLLADMMAGVEMTRDIAYGSHARQRLDVFHAHGARPDTVVIYIPGGGFTGGDKRSDDTFFANIGTYFARRGMIGITANYRLAPEVGWPAGAEDVAAVVAWAKANARICNGAARRVIVLGHSAGASHVASFLFDPEIRGHEQVAGGILISGGSYAVRKAEMRANTLAYFGSDDSQYERRSATRHVAGTKVPVLLAVAERDPPYLVTPTLELAIEVTKRDARCPLLLRLAGHNHFSPPCSLGTSDDELGGAALRFIAGLPQPDA